MAQNDSIKRKALGRSGDLAFLYDARRDNFIQGGKLYSVIPDKAKASVDIPFSDIHYVFDETYSEKFSQLNVEAGLKVSFLGGLFSAEGSGKYLNDAKSSKKTVRCSLVYRIQTKQDSLDVFHPDLKKHISVDAFQHGLATHVVTGVKWGADVVITFEQTTSSEQEATALSGNLKAHITLIAAVIEGNASLEHKQSVSNFFNSFSIKVFGDVLAPSNEPLPQTIDSAIKFLQNVPKYSQAYNGGRGKPLEFDLYPLALLRGDLQVQVATLCQELNADSVAQIEQEFDALLLAKQAYQDLVHGMEQLSEVIPQPVLTEVRNYNQRIRASEASFRENIGRALQELRNSDPLSDKNPVLGVLTTWLSGDTCAQGIQQKLDELAPTVQTIIDNYLQMKQRGVAFVKRGSSPHAVLMGHETDVYLLYTAIDLFPNNPEIYLRNFAVFLSLKTEAEEKKLPNAFWIVDYSIHPALREQDKPKVPRIAKYHKKQLITDNYITSVPLGCLVKPEKYEDLETDPDITKAVKQPLLLQCPNGLNGDCPSTLRQWNCWKCHKIVEVSLTGNIYCKCGSVPIEKCTFRCDDVHHGEARYDKFKDRATMFKLLGKK